MDPLSPLTYYLRHKRRALLQIALVGLATVGLFVLVGMLDAMPQRANVSYLTRLSRVLPAGGTLDPAVVSLLQAHADVARVIPDNGLHIGLPTLLGTDSQPLFGVSPGDAQFLMQHCDVRLKEGRMFEPRSNEFVLSEEVARALNLKLGSVIDRTVDEDYYYAVSAPLVLVGILEGAAAPSGRSPSVRLGFVSDEYLEGHELYAPRVTGLLVVAQPGRKADVDELLETTVRSKYTEVETFAQLIELLRVARIGVYVVFGIVNSVVSVAVAVVVGIINRIAITRRLSEFGLLYALGQTKRRLTRRLTIETAVLAGVGCLLGLAVALAVMSWLKKGLLYNLGMDLDLFNPAPFYFVLPIPLIVVALTFLSVRRVFARLDAVEIVERGKLSQESTAHGGVNATAEPLSGLTFYRRHRRRGMMIVASTALMLLGVTLPVFLLSAMTSAMLPYSEYLRTVSVVSPVRAELDPGVVRQIQSHPAVARVIPAVPLGVTMRLPPTGGTDVRIYGVSEADLPVLLERFGVQVQEGRLPRPRSNEIVLSTAIAANRGLHVGDVIGGLEEDPGVIFVDDVPTEMVVVGLLSPDRPWVGFVSSEYLRSHELTASRHPRLLVVPRAGQKEALDRWLQDNVDATLAHVLVHEVQEREDKQMTTNIVLTFALLECMVALVAALALAALNHIFFDQRRTEFGILNAIGRSRRWLLGRTAKETIGVVGLGWALGAAVCGIGLLAFQAFVYGPRGLHVNLLNPTPWLLTLPIPLAAIAASVGTIARMLKRFDPVSVIEEKEHQ